MIIFTCCIHIFNTIKLNLLTIIVFKILLCILVRHCKKKLLQCGKVFVFLNITLNLT